ncbi:pro-opiomelanocortin-like [Mastacembelus armatus]|uniref:Pro-opiomelanocortin-like n=1 Tax=Mastacembelus armatus TaxID=205130 RepID=A0A3Q3NDX2_9TELE|nr:pro-opiomelanocortin-like [Mastacembelus armatus]XP_026174633.1 pro-opiomelanocortin-like [Mastacembelus armatus]
MVCLCWLLLVVMPYMCIHGFGSACWNTSICNNLSNKERILDCIHLCMSMIKTEFPELNVLALKNNDNVDLLLNILLTSLASEDTIPVPDLEAHSDERRSYTMEHFRWGKLSNDKILKPKLTAHQNERRSYSMEHFRWGKPAGRKRRPVRVFPSSLEGGDSFEGYFPHQVRRQLSKDEENGNQNQKCNQNQALARVSSQPQVLANLQDRKDETYQMRHFRWGGPSASKRNGRFMKVWDEKPEGLLIKLFRNVIVKDVLRTKG